MRATRNGSCPDAYAASANAWWEVYPHAVDILRPAVVVAGACPVLLMLTVEEAWRFMFAFLVSPHVGNMTPDRCIRDIAIAIENGIQKSPRHGGCELAVESQPGTELS